MGNVAKPRGCYDNPEVKRLACGCTSSFLVIFIMSFIYEFLNLPNFSGKIRGLQVLKNV